MGEKSRLSILIPAYNNTESLKRALDSLQKQTIASQLNILISDDCSPSPINKEEIFSNLVEVPMTINAPEFLSAIKSTPTLNGWPGSS